MKIKAGVVLGSGIDILPYVTVKHRVTYHQLNLPVPSVPGHEPIYSIAEVAGKEVGILSGRVHLYEGFSPDEVCQQIRFLKDQGADQIVLTNAAGIVNKRFTPASLMIVKDQINLTGRTPFDFKKEKQFINVAGIYNVKKFKKFKRICNKNKVKLQLGVLAGVSGPVYETPAEVKMLKRMGADAVCMSTVLEAMYAHYLGMDVLGISVLTNYAGMDSSGGHDKIIRVSSILSSVIYQIIECYLAPLKIKEHQQV